ncbi:MAG TPA: hypothetical protein P5227_12980, partial [Emcibacteraceae bacterium]|nr:hypothetical protein [Emcibacteraceae bacterium]
MTNLRQISRLLLISIAAASLSAFTGCSDKNTELASLGETGENPGTGGSGGTGGGGGGGTVVACPTGTTEVTLGSGKACQISGTITQDLTLTADNTYLLSGKVTVGQETQA